MKLYCNISNVERWYAYSEATGWVMFPATIDGWNKRQPARGIDPMYVREVPLHLASNTGIPCSSDAAASLCEAA